MSSSVCSRCNQPGHFARDCTESDRGDGGGGYGGEYRGDRGRDGGGGGGYGGGGYRRGAGDCCEKCGSRDHINRDCKGGDMGCRCDGTGQLARDCSQDLPSCSNCGKPGHMSNECTEARKDDRRNVCYNCQERGHFAGDCPKERSSGGGERGSSPQEDASIRLELDQVVKNLVELPPELNEVEIKVIQEKLGQLFKKVNRQLSQLSDESSIQLELKNFCYKVLFALETRFLPKQERKSPPWTALLNMIDVYKRRGKQLEHELQTPSSKSGGSGRISESYGNGVGQGACAVTSSSSSSHMQPANSSRNLLNREAERRSPQEGLQNIHSNLMEAGSHAQNAQFNRGSTSSISSDSLNPMGMGNARSSTSSACGAFKYGYGYGGFNSPPAAPSSSSFHSAQNSRPSTAPSAAPSTCETATDIKSKDSPAWDSAERKGAFNPFRSNLEVDTGSREGGGGISNEVDGYRRRGHRDQRQTPPRRHSLRRNRDCDQGERKRFSNSASASWESELPPSTSERGGDLPPEAQAERKRHSAKKLGRPASATGTAPLSHVPRSNHEMPVTPNIIAPEGMGMEMSAPSSRRMSTEAAPMEHQQPQLEFDDNYGSTATEEQRSYPKVGEIPQGGDRGDGEVLFPSSFDVDMEANHGTPVLTLGVSAPLAEEHSEEAELMDVRTPDSDFAYVPAVPESDAQKYLRTHLRDPRRPVHSRGFYAEIQQDVLHSQDNVGNIATASRTLANITSLVGQHPIIEGGGYQTYDKYVNTVPGVSRGNDLQMRANPYQRRRDQPPMSTGRPRHLLLDPSPSQPQNSTRNLQNRRESDQHLARGLKRTADTTKF